MMMRWLCFIWVTVLAGHSEVLNTERFTDGSEVVLIAPINLLPSGGFFPLRVEVTNRGTDEMAMVLEGKANLSVQSGYGFSRSSNERSQIESSFQITCPPGEERVLDFLVPVHQSMGAEERFLVLVIKDGTGREIVSSVLSSNASRYRVGISGALYETVKINFRSARSGGMGRVVFPGALEDSIGEFSVADLPEDWRAFAGYDALLIGRPEFQAMSAGLKLALNEWVRSGGHLILMNDGGTLPPGLSEGSTQEGFGRQSIIEGGENYRDFEGDRLVKLLQENGNSLTLLHGGAYRMDWPLAELFGSRSLQTGLLLFALFIFAIVVGPVNLFVWAGPNRRHRLFITTPVISLTASLILVVFIIFRDGFGGDGARAIAIEVGGAGDKSEVVLQEQFSRSGILFSSSFSISDETVLNPVAPPSSEFNRDDSSSAQGTFDLEMSRTAEGWEIAGNLFESRSEQGQLLRAVRPSREGLRLISPPGAPPQLASSFSATLAPVFFTDEEGQVWQAGSLEPGETVVLTASNQVARDQALSATVERFGPAQQTGFDDLFSRRNSFAALAEGAAGLETHEAIDWEESPVVMTGLAERN